MNANELRIGNLIYIDNGEKPKYIYEVTAHDIDEIDGYGEDCFPIELTPEILEKCGFKRDCANNYWISLYNLKSEIHIEYYGSDYVNIIKGLFGELILDKIKYLHQLQNLIYALTGEELKITF